MTGSESVAGDARTIAQEPGSGMCCSGTVNSSAVTGRTSSRGYMLIHSPVLWPLAPSQVPPILSTPGAPLRLLLVGCIVIFIRMVEEIIQQINDLIQDD